MRDFLKFMKALSDPNRVKILKMLQRQVMCVCELQAALKLAQPTVSSHLKMLEEAGLVRSQKEHGLTGGASLVGAGACRPFSRAWFGRNRTKTTIIRKLAPWGEGLRSFLEIT